MHFAWSRYKQHGPCATDSNGVMRCGYSSPKWGEAVSALYLADWLHPAWQSVDAIFPSIYLSKGIAPDLQTAFIQENVNLSLRIARAAETATGRRPIVLPFGGLYYHGEFGPVNAAAKPRQEVATVDTLSCLRSLQALNHSRAWVSQEESGLMDSADVTLQMEASLAAGADGIVIWGGGTQPYLHTDECKEELRGWVASTLGPAVCAARRKACGGGK